MTAPGTHRETLSARAKRPLVLFPGALGDFLCFLPALRAIEGRSQERLTLVARGEWLALLHGNKMSFRSIDSREVGDLFGQAPPAPPTVALFAGHDPVHSWTGHGDPNFARRLKRVTGGSVFVHPFRNMRSTEHASQYFASCVGATAEVCTIEPSEEAMRWTEALWHRHGLGDRTLVIHPGSGSRAKNWQGMPALADAWRRRPGARVVVVLGPSEDDDAASVPSDATVEGVGLPYVAAVLRRGYRYVGNDSGISHLAGVVGAQGVALFGPTSPLVWRPQGRTVGVVHAPGVCDDCGVDRFCVHRLALARVGRALGLDDTALGT